MKPIYKEWTNYDRKDVLNSFMHDLDELRAASNRTPLQTETLRYYLEVLTVLRDKKSENKAHDDLLFCVL